MILLELLKILTDDTVLSTLLGSTVTNKKISPDYTISDGIYYTFNDVTYDKIKAQALFNLTIVNKELMQAYKIKDRLDELLLTFADNELTDNILVVTQNGGGLIYDSECKEHRLKVNYSIIYKK